MASQRSFRSLSLSLVFALLPGLALAGTLAAQAPSGPQATKVMDASALRPPAGASVAIVEFSDLECPACAHYNPLLVQAAAQYKIPLVRHDFTIPSHPWSPVASIDARWFDSKGNGLGDAYRNAIFASQSSIYNVNVLADFTQKFAQSHGLSMPFSVDPQGKLAAEVKADTDLGKRTGVQHTPTVFIVVAHAKGPSYMEVLNLQTDLYKTIDQAIAESKEAATQHRASK